MAMCSIASVTDTMVIEAVLEANPGLAARSQPFISGVVILLPDLALARTDVTNLMQRVGMQVGIGEGRPDSRDSAGLGWGTFRLE